MKQINNNTVEPYVSFEVAKLLKENGFEVPVWHYFSNIFNTYCGIKSNLINPSEGKNWNDETIGDSPMHKRNAGYISRPTIQLAVSWIFENFGIWIYVLPIDDDMKLWQSRIIKGEIFNNINNTLKIINSKGINGLHSPGEAYNAAIEYIFKNLIE